MAGEFPLNSMAVETLFTAPADAFDSHLALTETYVKMERQIAGKPRACSYSVKEMYCFRNMRK